MIVPCIVAKWISLHNYTYVKTCICQHYSIFVVLIITFIHIYSAANQFEATTETTTASSNDKLLKASKCVAT